MMGEPLVTVIINTYNDAYCVGQAVQSALDQTYKRLQILVYNNCSTDATNSVLLAFCDPRLEVIDAGHHTELSRARNLALASAEGDFICFLDSDDTWKPEKIETQVSAMRQSNLDFCFTNFHFSDSGVVGRPVFKGGNLDSLAHSLPLEASYPVALSTLIFRRGALDETPFDESTHITGDYRLVTGLARSHTWQMLAEPLVIITRRSEGESASKAELMVRELIDYSDILRERDVKPASSFVRLRALEIGAQKLRSDLNSRGILRLIMSKPYFLWYAIPYAYHRLHQTIRMRR